MAESVKHKNRIAGLEAQHRFQVAEIIRTELADGCVLQIFGAVNSGQSQSANLSLPDKE
jgi:hypothetical protein